MIVLDVGGHGHADLAGDPASAFVDVGLMADVFGGGENNRHQDGIMPSTTNSSMMVNASACPLDVGAAKPEDAWHLLHQGVLLAETAGFARRNLAESG